MRAFKLFPRLQVSASNLSKDAVKRLEWFDWYFTHGKNISLTCRHFGISRDTFYLWKKRFNPRNLQSLEFDTKTRRPKHVRQMTTPRWVQKRIYEIRQEDIEKSKYEIQAELKDEGIIIGRKCIEKIIKRHKELQNIQHHKRLRKHRHYKIARIKAARELREKTLGSLVQMDTKYLTIFSHQFYLFSAIDCKSRFAFIYPYTSITSASGKDFLTRVRAYFPFPIQAINTDNGSEYLKAFHEELTIWGIPHFFTDPHCPKQNGRVERLHQTAEYEYFNHQPLIDDLATVREYCMRFNQKYNYHRYHQALGYQKPAEYVRILQEKQKGELYVI
jgi:putative transposase